MCFVQVLMPVASTIGDRCDTRPSDRSPRPKASKNPKPHLATSCLRELEHAQSDAFGFVESRDALACGGVSIAPFTIFGEVLRPPGDDLNRPVRGGAFAEEQEDAWNGQVQRIVLVGEAVEVFAQPI